MEMSILHYEAQIAILQAKHSSIQNVLRVQHECLTAGRKWGLGVEHQELEVMRGENKNDKLKVKYEQMEAAVTKARSAVQKVTQTQLLQLDCPKQHLAPWQRAANKIFSLLKPLNGLQKEEKNKQLIV
jgi:hypothetical protein